MRTRQYRARVWLNEQEYQELRRNIEQTGLSQEAYLRLVILNNIPKPLPPIEYHAMIRELHAIGSSLQQVATQVRSQSNMNADTYQRDVELLRKTLLEIQTAILVPEKYKPP